MKTLAGGLEKGTAVFLCLIDQKSQHHQHREYGRQMPFPMSIVVFELVVLILQGVKYLVFNVPATAASFHD